MFRVVLGKASGTSHFGGSAPQTSEVAVIGMDAACERSRRRRGTLVLGDPPLDALFPRDSADSSEHWKTFPTAQHWTTKRTRFVR